MFLRRISIDGLRSIQHLDLPLTRADDPRRRTFVLGENGTGKSSLLRAIALVLAGSEALPELLGTPGDWVRRGEKQARIRAELETAEGEPRSAELVIGATDTIRDVYDRNRPLLEDLDRAFAHTSRSYFTVGYGVSRRPAPPEAGMTPAGTRFRNLRAQSVATLFSGDASLISLPAWAMDLDYRKQGAYDIIQRAADDLLPDITFERIDRERRELIFNTPDGEVSYAQLSGGYRNVAAWTGDLLFHITTVFDDYDDPFAVRGLLLIDEIDLHLHARWQRDLLHFFERTFPRLQLVATTNSPLTVHQAGEGELFVLRRPEPGAPAELQAYDGAPRDLMLHQLLLSPLFGLDSLDSRPIEVLKGRYRELRDAPRRAPEEDAELASLTKRLEDLPDWTHGIREEANLDALMSEIESELRSKP